MSDGAGRSIRAKLIVVISSLCGSLMVALAGAEFAVRYRDGHRNTVPGGMFLYYPHERLRQALVRNSTYYRWVHINGQGFRGSRDVGAKPRDTHRIMAVGESTTFDGSVSADSLAWPARLEHWLDTFVPSCRAEVINAGVPGYRMLDNLIRLHTELLQYEPDVVLLYHPHNDLSRTLHAVPWRGDQNRPDEATYTSPVSRWLTRHSLLYAKSRARSYMVGARRINAKYAAEPAPAVIEQGVRRYQDELASFLTLAQARGVKVVLIEAVHVSGSGTITEPDSVIRREWEVNFPAISTETLLATYQRFSEAQRETAARFGATVIATSGFGLRGLKWFSTGDPIHFNDQGADRMALKVAETLAGGLLGGPDCTTQTPSTGAR